MVQEIGQLLGQLLLIARGRGQRRLSSLLDDLLRYPRNTAIQQLNCIAVGGPVELPFLDGSEQVLEYPGPLIVLLLLGAVLNRLEEAGLISRVAGWPSWVNL